MLTLDNLSKTYANGTLALQSASLSVAEGEIVALIGGSGCGKTTLLRLISGLERPSAGKVVIDGEEVFAPHPAIGMIFQEARLLPWLTVAENIVFGLDISGRGERADVAERVLVRLGLAGYGGRWPRELSGGQAQRVAIGRALVARPKVLLLDEPFSALDAFTRADLQETLLTLWAAERPTLLLVTHDVEEALVLADRVVVMQPHPGRIFREIDLTMPRPRDRLSASFIAEKRRVLQALDGSLATRDRASAGEAEAVGLWW